MSHIRIIIAGGGTGGHIFPAVAVANAIRSLEPRAEILFVGAKGKMEMEKVPQAGYRIEGLDIAGFNRSHWWKNISLPFKLVQSFMQVRGIFNAFRPQAAFGVGGYSSYPVLRLAQARGIPTFLHESNAFAGKSNILLGKQATRVFVAAEGMERFFPANKIVVSGNPVRKEIAGMAVSREAALASFGLRTEQLTVLVVGGSLGARSVNLAIQAGLDKLQAAGLQLIWQTGKPFAAEARNAVAGRTGIWQNDFIAHMDHAYAAADIVISRSGAMSVTELCMAGKPVVFVPFPYAAEDHQTANAMALVKENAAVLVKDSDAATQLTDTVIALAGDEEKRKSMADRIRHMARYDADILIAKQILESIHAVA
jgi:UDP-N-acetylglucosamine--N-acetylmuramyl-(pentapeptide) pyrophosphoryl-undecaprenol N-acetylglucosamine transferase